MATKKRKYSEMSIDDLVADGLSDSSEEETSTFISKSPKRKTKGDTLRKPDDKKSKIDQKESAEKKKKKKKTDQEGSVEEKVKTGSVKSHKKQIENLKENDPEFYKFLEKEDQDLLNFQDSEDSDDDDNLDLSASSDSEDEERGGKHHQLPQKLQVDSDDSDGSGDDDEDENKPAAAAHNQIRVTQKLVSQWESALHNQSSIKTLRPVIQAFKSAVHSGEEETTNRYKVDDSLVFNAVVRLALTRVLPAVTSILNLPQTEVRGKRVLSPGSSPHWKKISHDVKSYISDIIKMLVTVKEPAIVNVVLRHIYQLVPYYLVFPKLVKSFLKTLIGIWSEGDESSRVLAFLSIVKLVRCRQEKTLEPCLKQMYMSYVKNCKFTSPATLPLINFMQRSLVELFSMDTDVAYQHAFIYIRQLAIHLRNAMTVKKKENIQAVYNWQYIHSLSLWTLLVSQLRLDESISALIYPLVQIIIGTVKLVPSPRYYPLRFHCIRMLNTISSSTGVFIPVLPLLLEVFELTDFNRKPKTVSFKPFNFAVILKLSKTQLQEKSFREGVIDQLFELFLENFHAHAHSVGFPEMSLPAVIQIKEFLKKCKVANFSKQMKQILDRVKEESNFISQRRKKSSVDLRDGKSVEEWESRVAQEGTPLTKYYSTWRRSRDRELTIGVAARDQIVGEDRLPEIIRQKPKTLDALPAGNAGLHQADLSTREEFSALFDGSDGEEDETRFMLKEERPKKIQKKNGENDEKDSESDYSEFDDDELDVLARSADEDDDDDDIDDDDDDDDDEDDDDDDDDGEDDEDDDGAVGVEIDNEDDSGEDDDDDDDVDDEGDIVKDFTFSDDES